MLTPTHTGTLLRTKCEAHHIALLRTYNGEWLKTAAFVANARTSTHIHTKMCTHISAHISICLCNHVHVSTYPCNSACSYTVYIHCATPCTHTHNRDIQHTRTAVSVMSLCVSITRNLSRKRRFDGFSRRLNCTVTEAPNGITPCKRSNVDFQSTTHVHLTGNWLR